MASAETSCASASRNPNHPIICRDGNGVERKLIVSVLPVGLVVLGDRRDNRVLSKAAIELALELIHATRPAGQGSGRSAALLRKAIIAQDHDRRRDAGVAVRN